MTTVKNKTILITGGASGIGKKMALMFRDLGAKIVIWDIHQENMDKMKQQNIHTYTCNVADRNEVYRVADQVTKDVGPVDILINNAGVVNGKNLLESQDEHIERTFNINTLALFWTTKAFLPKMLERNSGHIVTIASAAGITGVSKLTDYSASKFAAFSFDESLRMELSKMKSRVQTTVICPCYINTGMFDGVKTKIPFLLPILEEDYVAGKIVNAVLKNKRRVIMPWIVYTVWPLRILPVCLFDFICNLLGINSSMDEFKKGM
ncbi:MAG: SDR family oxidoreductase [Bacteriovoracaceae bacterium]|nr:SDR family oxidoreductase [Bacteriovoracaceae bacterium]